jgi:outer membrane protein assembly factor BamB
MTRIAGAALALMLLAGNATAGDAPDAAAIVKATGIRGGLCLVIGAKASSLAEALAKESALYVQILQPEWKAAQAWGLNVAAGPGREQLGVRNAAFDAEHYDSNLFNLIVVEDAAALGKAKAEDLFRILVPRGAIVFRKVPEGFADAATKLKMEPVSVGGFAAAFRKPVRPVEWKLPLAMKWQAGPRSQIARGYAGISLGEGMLFYLERTEADLGDLNISTARLVARNAYNGRTIWARDVGRWGGVGLTANKKGRLFIKTRQDKNRCKVVQLDGATGKTLLEMPSAGHRDSRLKCLTDDLLYVGGRIYKVQTGKFLWRFPSYRYQPMPGTIIGDSIYFCEGKTLEARKFANGKPLWKKPLLKLPAKYIRMSRAGNNLLIRMAAKRDEYSFAVVDPSGDKILWTYTWKITISNKERYFSARNVKFTTVDGKLLLYYRHNQMNSYADEVVVTRLDLATGREEIKDRVLKNAGDFHGCFGERHLGDYVAWYDLWLNKKTLETTRVRMPHPACFFGSKNAYGLVYNFPSRKSGPITAVGPADTKFEKAPGGKVLKTYEKAPPAEATKPGDWPMFRGGPAGGNSTKATLGDKLVKVWEAPIGLGVAGFGIMSSQRTGLTQAVVAYGLAVVADINGQRIVAVNAADGKQKWAFHVGSRVDYPPTLYNGLCLFAARDGWVYCLNAKTGKLVYKLLAAPQERYIGGREKLESRWPLASDVLIANGVAHAGGVAFKPATGETVAAKSPGRELMMSHDLLLKGNSIPRTNEDNKHGFRMRRFKRKLDARALAFDNALTVTYHFYPKGEGWANRGMLQIRAIEKDPKKPLWQSPAIELVVSDMVLTPDYVYCAGHYQRAKKDPELWILSRKDGKVVKRLPAGGFPAFMGMSASGKRLFISTRDGKLICFEGR